MSQSRTASTTHDTPAVDESPISGPASGDADAEEEPALSKDEIFHLLQNERRRFVLQFLQGKDDSVRMPDIAEQVAAWENDTTVEQLSSQERQRVYIPLYQSHLPKLDKAGIIDYNQSRGIVERKPLADEMDRYIDAERDGDGQGPDASARPDFASGRFVGFTGVSAMVFLGAILEVTAFSPLSMAILFAVGLLGYTLMTAEKFNDGVFGRTDQS
ncbi:DUF7344 domain-containing protein [Natronosalvus halobius]|uniref:DUF7344 domain-containing protein n=1 Tax=Natronosalvus halobius TaxID=2953746 RepID=UPI00209CE249|nr:hypothetical protein [Natronosalvus halobius]USZ70649.1 hypothetical protein NGM15_11085 [Natronosalvus halobius]